MCDPNSSDAPSSPDSAASGARRPTRPQGVSSAISMATVYSRVQIGIEAISIAVEAHLSNGLPCFHIVGLPEKGVRESKERVRSAILNAGFRFPDRHITVNLAPAHLPKPDSHLDLAIALSILRASGQLKASLDGHEFYGELALSGEMRPIRHILAAAVGCAQAKQCMIAPPENARMAVQVEGLLVKSAESLLSVCHYLEGQAALPRVTEAHVQASSQVAQSAVPDLGAVRGQAMAKRAMVLAAAGGHHVVLRGAPGVGKTMLAQCLVGLLPPMAVEERLDVMLLHTLRDLPYPLKQRPFRQPHHSASYAAMVGGGQPLMPGEVSLAHGGVLFLDEMHEFKPSVLNSLREPLERGCIHLSRAGAEARFPASFMLVGACNPCPCGYWGQARCQCTPAQVQRYQQRVSGPLWDRIDLVVDMQPVTHAWPSASPPIESPAIQSQVSACRLVQAGRQGCSNAQLPTHAWHGDDWGADAKAVLMHAAEHWGMSMRGIHRVAKVARTIADWEQSKQVVASHVHEAVSYRATIEV